MDRPLLMIPGPIEISPAVQRAAAAPPPGHLVASFMEDFARALAAMRDVWRAGPDAQPFVVSGSGTLAMEMAIANVVDAGDRVVIVQTGFFSDRLAEMARRRGAVVTVVTADAGCAPPVASVADAIDRIKPKVLGVTHVDTSTGVRVDAEGLAKLARAAGVLSVFDGVCATGAEPFEMEAWGADVYLTASQKAIGLPPGLALLVAGPRAIEARAGLKALPPLSIDFDAWQPVMQAYEAGRPSYFATPATSLVGALRVGLDEIVGTGDPAVAMAARWAMHARAAAALREGFAELGLLPLPASPEITANTLSALLYPAGIGPALVGAVRERGVIVAGGLHPARKDAYFRVGHMGWAAGSTDALLRTVLAIGEALVAQGHATDVEQAVTRTAAALSA